MFTIALSTTGSLDNICYEIELPQVPSVGDTISMDAGGDKATMFEVKSRRFLIEWKMRSITLRRSGAVSFFLKKDPLRQLRQSSIF